MGKEYILILECRDKKKFRYYFRVVLSPYGAILFSKEELDRWLFAHSKLKSEKLRIFRAEEVDGPVGPV